MPDNADDFINESGGYPTVKFDAEGAILVADLVEPRVGVQRKFGTTEAATWEDGTPKKQLVLDVKVDRAKSNDISIGKEDDTDVGTVYCKHELKKEIARACDEAGLKLSQVGRIVIRRLEDGPPPKPGFHPTQMFKAKVERAVNTSADDLDGF
jgi:hypothetical protein